MQTSILIKTATKRHEFEGDTAEDLALFLQGLMKNNDNGYVFLTHLEIEDDKKEALNGAK